MAAKLYKSDGSTVLCKSIRVKPGKNIIKIEKTTLDGKPDIQTIGEAEQIFDIECLASYSNLLEIIDAAANVETVILNQGGISYNCFIKKTPRYSLKNMAAADNRYYQINMTLSCTD